MEFIKSRLQGNVLDCAAPCFWGIVPGQTTLDAAISILTHLGLEIWGPISNNKEFYYGSSYDLDTGLSIAVSLNVNDKIVRNLEINIDPEKKKAGVPREWLAYSPETLIRRYGQPSKVDFFVGRGSDTLWDMRLYFDEVDLIVEYFSYDLGPNLRACPLIDQIKPFRVWLGKNPVDPPLPAILLEDATSMTMQEYTKSMTGIPDNACFNLKEEMFP